MSPESDSLRRIDDTLHTKYWCWTFYDRADSPSTLLEVLQSGLPSIPAESWPERFDFGGIYINGYPALADSALPFPCRVEYYEPKFEIARAHELYPAFEQRYVLYSDSDIVIVYKPARLPSMPAKEQRHYSIKAALERTFDRPVHMPSRLDVSAQGLLVVSINPACHALLQRMFEHREIRKMYRLATHVESTAVDCTVDKAIGRDNRHPVLRSVVDIGGQTAVTSFKSLHSHRGDVGVKHVLAAEPVTGRTHQIRVHAAYLGTPILGDNFYGGAPSDHLHLVSVAAEFYHPATAERIAIEIPSSLAPSWVFS